MVNDRSFVNPDGLLPQEPLTSEQVERYKRFKAEGMKPELALAAVRGRETDAGG